MAKKIENFRIKLCNHERSGRSKWLKSLYPTAHCITILIFWCYPLTSYLRPVSELVLALILPLLSSLLISCHSLFTFFRTLAVPKLVCGPALSSPCIPIDLVPLSLYFFRPLAVPKLVFGPASSSPPLLRSTPLRNSSQLWASKKLFCQSVSLIQFATSFYKIPLFFLHMCFFASYLF